VTGGGFFSRMWFDRVSGRLFRDPRELDEAVRTADPLLMKAWLRPERITPEEQEELALRLLSHMADYLPEADIRDVIENEERESDPVAEQTAREMLEGKLAMRELGTLRQKRLGTRPVLVSSVRFLTAEDVIAALQRTQPQPKRGQGKKTNSKPRPAPKKKSAGKAPRKSSKSTKSKRRKRR
jgi:hypothetical protein